MNMKNIFSMLLFLVLLALQLTVYGEQSYDVTKSVNRNLYDAVAAIANAHTAFLNNVLFVDGDRTDDYTADGSLAAPYKTIQAADMASVSGDVIIVAPGAYAETVTLNVGVHLFGWEVTGATLTGDYVLFDAGGMTLTGDLAVDTDVLSVNAANDIVEINGWLDLPYIEITATPYTITAASKANYYVVNYTDTGAASVVLGSDVFVDGRWIVIKDGELNANNNNITISTEGDETIDEAAAYVINAAGESVLLLSDGANMFVMDGYKE